MQQDKPCPIPAEIFSTLCVSVPCFYVCAALRALDILSDEVLMELSAAYRRMVSHPAPRNLTMCITLSITLMFAHCLLTCSPSNTAVFTALQRNVEVLLRESTDSNTVTVTVQSKHSLGSSNFCAAEKSLSQISQNVQ